MQHEDSLWLHVQENTVEIKALKAQVKGLQTQMTLLERVVTKGARVAMRSFGERCRHTRFRLAARPGTSWEDVNATTRTWTQYLDATGPQEVRLHAPA